MDTSFDETFASAADRADALKQLIAGSEDYYYYHCLHQEQRGKLEEVGKLLDTWVQRHGWTARAQEIRRRKALLEIRKKPDESFELIRQELGLSFDHEREVEGAADDLPTRIQPKDVDLASWTALAWQQGGSSDLRGFSDDGLERLAAGKLEPDRRRAFLQRLRRPDVPNLPDLVLADLKHKHSGGFGSLPIHGRLTLAQLEELAKKDSSLLKVEPFVHALLLRSRPGPEDEWRDELQRKAAYLDELWDHVRDLAPAFNALKAHVLYHRLDVDRAQGVLDRGRFDEYVKIPRQTSYASPKYLEACAHDPARRGGVVTLGRDFDDVTGLPAVADDEALVVDVLQRLFVEAKDYRPYETWMNEGWLRIVFAESKILAGAGDAEKWTAQLNDPTRAQALKERVELSFPAVNKTRFRGDEKVSIALDVKNVPSLVIKVFEVNALNVFLAKGEDVDTSLDLDGLVAAEERVLSFDEPPTRRVRRSFDFPSLAWPGVYVVEFIGGGISSRALIRKGRLRFVERVGAAGHVFTVLDEDFTALRDASVWMGGREYAADANGEIAVPFSERPGRQAILLRHGGLTTLEAFEHRAESYRFSAGIHVDREALLRGATAQVFLRPSLRAHGAPVGLELLENVALEIRCVDRFGVESTREIRGLELRDDRETLVDIQVPDDVASLSFRLRARLEALGGGRKIDVSDERAYALNGIDASEHTQDLHLARTEKGYVVAVRGKSGEARPNMPVHVRLQHREFAFERDYALKSDERGRVELGILDGITRIHAALPSGVEQTWTPPRDACRRSSTLHARAGEAARVPWFGGEPRRESLALLERVEGTYRADWFEALSAKDGYLQVGPLGPGDYELALKDENATIELKVSDGVRAAGWLAAPTRLLEESPAPAPQISKIKAGKDELKVRVENATSRTRAHVFATRWLPAHSALHELGASAPAPWASALSSPPSAYVSGRDIGDELRYILERRRSPRRPGNPLARPGLLLNPWALRDTSTDRAVAAEGEAYGGVGAPAPCQAAPACEPPPPPPPPGAAFSSLDFLANPSVVIANLRPDADGHVSVPRKALAHANQVRIVLVDEASIAVQDVLLPECATAPRDLRLRLGLDPAAHFSERKDVSVVAAGSTLEIADVTTTKLEIYDSLGRAFSLYRTLSKLPALDAFEFVTRWPSLSPAEKRAKYSEFACHELHFFLSKKDPAFFKEVVQPYLRHKKDKTFLDRYLLGDDLSAWREPWAFGRLNIVERILLGRRIAEERDPVKRHAADLRDALGRDLLAENALFETALKGKALETGDAFGMAAAARTVSAERMRSAKSALPAMASGPMDLAMAEESCADDAEAERSVMKEDEARPKPAAKSRKRAQDRDLRRRKEASALYRSLDQTREWAENNYYKRPIAEQGPELVTINRFWRDYAAHDDAKPFVSPYLSEAGRDLTEILFALAVLDLPFEAAAPESSFDGPRMKLKPRSLSAVFHRQIRPAEPSAEKVPVLVSQNFLRDDDRQRYEGDESFDKYVAEEFLVHTVYVGQVVLTNPTSSTHKLDLLLQIPLGSLPAKNGFFTKGIHLELSPYATETYEYAFYFPAAGTYAHYPVHVSRNETLVASAVPWPLKVVERLSQVDTTSWEHVSQHADAKTALKFLKDNNLERLDLERAAWRMKEKGFYEAALDLLRGRHVYQDTLWSYAIYHQDPSRAEQYLRHQDEWAKSCGAVLESPALTLNPVERRIYEHLEYAPLVNARAHRLGASRRILNDRFSEQYQRLMGTLRYRKELGPDDRLALTYYLFLQDRVEEALERFSGVKREDVETKLQYDYLQVYADVYRERLKAARAVAEKYKDYPVERWRKLFEAARARLEDEATSDAADRDAAQEKRAAEAPGFELAVEGRQVTLTHRNLEAARVNYYKMDLELLFSRQPFVQDRSERFSFIMPNRSDVLQLPKKEGSKAFPLPAEFHGTNVVVEAVADGRRVSSPCFAHELDVALAESFGQLKVTRRGSKDPLSKAYVKVYARGADGETRFYKDGYTDARGRFDYASLSTDDLDRVERFALLVMSDEHGAVVKEAAAPKR